MSLLMIVAVLLLGLIAWAAVNSMSTEVDGAATSRSESASPSTCINPATGLPMIAGEPYGFDVGGNLYGSSSDEDMGNSTGVSRSLSHDLVSGSRDFGDDPMSLDSPGSAGDRHPAGYYSGPSLSLMELGAFQGDATGPSEIHMSYTNPATGLPMISDSPAGIDVGGNAYGMNNHDFLDHHDSFSSHGSFDSFDSGSSFGSGSDWS